MGGADVVEHHVVIDPDLANETGTSAHVPGDEPLPVAGGQVAEAGQVLAADGGAGFHLNGDQSAVGGFQDGVHLDAIPGAVVVQPGTPLRPGELAGQFHQHERFHHRPGRTIWFAQPRRVLAEQVCRAAADIALVASELTANAWVHGQPPIMVMLRLESSSILVEVSDAGPGIAEFSQPGPLGVHGHGLPITATLADEFGLFANRVGKTLWARLHMQGQVPPEDEIQPA